MIRSIQVQKQSNSAFRELSNGIFIDEIGLEWNQQFPVKVKEMSDRSGAIYWRLSEQVAFWNGLLLEMETRGPREVDGERYFIIFFHKFFSRVKRAPDTVRTWSLIRCRQWLFPSEKEHFCWTRKKRCCCVACNTLCGKMQMPLWFNVWSHCSGNALQWNHSTTKSVGCYAGGIVCTWICKLSCLIGRSKSFWVVANRLNLQSKLFE